MAGRQETAQKIADAAGKSRKTFYEDEKKAGRKFQTGAEYAEYKRATAVTPNPKRVTGDLNEETTRLRAAQAELAELDAAVRRGELVPFEDVKIVFAGALAGLRRDMEAIPGRTAMQLSAMTDPGEIREFHLRETRQALGSAADRLQDLLRTLAAGGPAEGAATPDAGRVGRRAQGSSAG